MAVVTYGSAGAGIGFDITQVTIGDLFLYDFTNLSATVLRVFDDANNYTQFGGTGFAGTTNGAGGELTDVTAGIVNSITFVENGVTLLSMTGLSVSAPALFDLYVANDTAGALALVFGGADTITGTAFADTIVGYAGNDTFNPGGGADTIRWKQNDGFDTFNGDNVNQDIVALEGVLYDVNWERSGNDLLVGGAIDDNYDWADIGGNIRLKNFFSGSDTIAYLSFTTQFGDYDRGSGERLYFSAVNGTNQGNFEETVIGTDAGQVMTGGGGVFDAIEAFGGNDTMSVSNGTLGNFFGGDGADTMTGANLRDRFVGGNGADTINGNAGNDLVRYNRSGGSSSYSEGVFVNLSSANETQTFESVLTTVNAGRAIDNWNNTDIFSSIEDIHGSEFADVLIGSSAVNVIQGFQGDDLIKGNAGADVYVWQLGDGFDTVLGDNLSQDIVQLQGTFHDTEWGKDGNDLLVGGVINDNYDFAESGGAIRFKNFFAGADSLAYITADLGANNNFHFPYDGSGPIRVYFSAVTGTNQGAFEEEIIGTSGNDTMTGGGGAADYFFGDDGNDTITASNGTSSLLRGGNGTDTLTGADRDDNFRGGDGNDTINGQGGIDRVEYHRPSGSSTITKGAFVNLSTVSRTLLFNAVSTTVAAGKALDNWGSTDTLSNIENIRGSDFADILIGNAGDNFIEGRNGNDTIEGGDGDNDFVQGEAGNDTLNGGAGNSDTVSYYNSQSGVSVNLLAGTASDGFGGTDTLSNFEEVLGSFFNDSITGGTGDDIIQGYAGDDNLNGGAGTRDGVDFYDDQAGVTVNLLAGTASDGYGDTDTLSNFEEVYGSFFTDNITGNGFDNYLEGRDGDDTLTGGDGDDGLNGGDGDDTLDGGGGADTMLGGLGNDTYRVDDAGDVVTEAASAGLELVNTTLNNYSLFFVNNVERATFVGSGDFVGRGNALDNRIEGGAGNDRFLVDQGGADRYFGGLGTADTLDYRLATTGAVIDLQTGVHGGAALGDFFSSIEYFYGSNTAADTMTGSNFNDRFDGYGGNDTLAGLGGTDTLNGGDGDDEISGGALIDFLSGNAGADDFNYADVAESGPTSGARDRIYDFQAGSDDIDVSVIDARAGSAGNNAFTAFIGAAAFTAEGQVRWFQSGANTIVEFNTAGTSGAEMQIQLQNFTAANLTAADFIA